VTGDEIKKLCDAIWKANSNTAQRVAQASMKEFPLPPIMANLEIMSDKQFSKLLADIQKRSFYHGAVAMLTALELDAAGVTVQ